MKDDLPDKTAWLKHLYPWLVLPLIASVLVLVAVIPMTWQQQAVFGVLVVIAAFLIDRRKQGQNATILLVLLCLCATSRYAYWRSATLWKYLRSPWSHVGAIGAVLMVILLAAELYTFVILVLGFFQSIAPLKRPPLLLPDDPELWPTVDVLIPTFNESLDVVRYTVLAAQQMDWPAEKLNVILLDDGGRSEFRAFAAQAGVAYIARTDRSGAKAGNLNNALRQTRGQFVTIFDCDHIPTRSFLQISIGWFLRDQQLAMLQTPHHFYSPDPFERNLGKFREIPNEGSLFYGIVQDANDLWNATFFCGSCAVLRRSALDEVGGIAQETVTEDAHTSLRLQKAGWNTAYINIPQAAGLATETLARHVKQRIRWARGMVQILRIDNPLLAGGLKLSQRLCYFNATLHFLYALPRLIFLTAPLLYLLFGLSNVPGYWLAILAFAGPHLALSTITNSRIQGSKRFSFWNEIYETVLSPYILLPTFLALINPRFGKFNVTDKGGAQEKGYFSLGLSVPFLCLLGLNLTGLALAIPRYLYWDRGHAGTIWMNVFWAAFNVVILGVALSVCAEERQRRHAVRISCAVPVMLRAAGETVEATTADISTSGLAARISAAWAPGEPVEIWFPEETVDESLRGTLVGGSAHRMGIQFAELSLPEQRLLTRVLYSRADRWLEWDEGFTVDSPLRSLFSVLRSSAAGFWKLLFLAPGSIGASPKPLKAARVAAITSLLLLVLGLAFWRANASTTITRGSKEVAPEVMERSFSLGSLRPGGATLLLEQPGSREILKFATPSSWLIRGGKLHLKYQIPKNALDEYTYADVRLNDTILASVNPSQEEREAGAGELWVPLPAGLLLAKNELTIQLAGQGNGACSAAGQRDQPWFRIDPSSEVSLSVQPLILASELAALPEPFLEHLANAPVHLPMVFMHAPDGATLESAGVLASWFGAQADDSGVRYDSRLGELPTGNAIVLLVGSESLEGIEDSQQASVSIRENPNDRYGKLLVIHGQTGDDLLAVAQALATGQLKMAGSATRLTDAVQLPIRTPNDAPRWIHTSRVSLNDLVGRAERRTNGQSPVNVYMHLAPDYNFGVQQDMYLHLAYAVDSPDLAKSSNIAAALNGVSLGSVPLLNSGHSVDIPLVDVPAAVYANTLQLQFYFVPAGADACAPGAGNASAQILGSSFLDLGGAVHYTELPNLRLFAKAGFPFTRMADLAQTAVLLPANPGPEVTGLYLDLMGYFGAQTGYPALRVQVVFPSEVSRFRDKDVLMLGTFADLSSTPEITGMLPLTYSERSFTLSQRARWGILPDRLLGRNKTLWQTLDVGGTIWPEGLLEGIASPFAQGRSVVVIAGRDTSALPHLTSALLTTMPLDGIDNTVSLWTGGNFISYPLSTAVYGSGQLPWYRAIGYWLPHHLTVLLVLLLVVLGLLGWCTQRFLAAQIQHRLRLGSSPATEVLPAS